MFFFLDIELIMSLHRENNISLSRDNYINKSRSRRVSKSCKIGVNIKIDGSLGHLYMFTHFSFAYFKTMSPENTGLWSSRG